WSQDRAAAAEVNLLLRRINRPTQVDEVEISAADHRAAEVAAAEVRLANLLGTLEVALIVVVGVKAGARPFRGNRREQQAAARRAHVERRVRQVRDAQAAVLPVDVAEPRLAQPGAG